MRVGSMGGGWKDGDDGRWRYEGGTQAMGTVIKSIRDEEEERTRSTRRS